MIDNESGDDEAEELREFTGKFLSLVVIFRLQ